MEPAAAAGVFEMICLKISAGTLISVPAGLRGAFEPIASADGTSLTPSYEIGAPSSFFSSSVTKY